MNVVLISTYELGRQPFGLASPAAWLREFGANVECQDLALEPLDEASVRRADLVAFYLPMHTAARIAVRVVKKVGVLNPSAELCAYGLYAPVNEEFLRRCGVSTILGGEFENQLVSLVGRLGRDVAEQPEPRVSLERLTFRVPDRDGLPALNRYAHLNMPDGSQRTVGYTEASRGCKHLCRHCPIVPVYGGRFRVVQKETVLEDVCRQVAAGAEHITFGDPDFFNGPKHSTEIIEALHREHPDLTYDVTIKVEHLLGYSQYVALLRDTGCVFVTTAVESVDDRILQLFDKNHTRADLFRVVELFDEIGLAIHPTFVAFHPWLTLRGYKDFLEVLTDLDLSDNVAPIQLAIRLLIPAGSKLLELQEVQAIIGPFDEEALCYPWKHPDSRVDALQRRLECLVESWAASGKDRRCIFARAFELVHSELDEPVAPIRDVPPGRLRETIPYLTEPWYC